MDRFESRMTPRFLAESEKGMLWEPRVIESGRETVEGLKEDESGKKKSLFCRRSVWADYVWVVPADYVWVVPADYVWVVPADYVKIISNYVETITIMRKYAVNCASHLGIITMMWT